MGNSCSCNASEAPTAPVVLLAHSPTGTPLETLRVHTFWDEMSAMEDTLDQLEKYSGFARPRACQIRAQLEVIRALCDEHDLPHIKPVNNAVSDFINSCDMLETKMSWSAFNATPEDMTRYNRLNTAVEYITAMANCFREQKNGKPVIEWPWPLNTMEKPDRKCRNHMPVHYVAEPKQPRDPGIRSRAPVSSEDILPTPVDSEKEAAVRAWLANGRRNED